MSVQMLRKQAESAFDALLGALDGISEAEAWAALPAAGDDYLHTDGSVYGLTLHVACCKIIYGSVGFRDSEVRWRHLADRVEKFEPSWEASLDLHREAQAYWMASWEGLQDADLDSERPHFSGKLWPAWKIIDTVIQHDAYHAGQIAIVRYATQATSKPPASVAEDIRTHCPALPSW